LRHRHELRYLVHGCLHLFGSCALRGLRVWIRVIRTSTSPPSRSPQRSPPIQRFRVPRSLGLLLQAPRWVLLHLLHHRQIRLLPLQIGPGSSLTRTLLPSWSRLRRLSLPRHQMLHPKRIRPFWCLFPKGEIDSGSRDRGLGESARSSSFCCLSRFCGVSR
jgi:hypothetical protein